MGDAPVFVRWLSNLMGSSPDKAAADLTYLATVPDLANVTGKFYKGRVEIRPDAYALDASAQRQLWDASVQMLGL